MSSSNAPKRRIRAVELAACIGFSIRPGPWNGPCIWCLSRVPVINKSGQHIRELRLIRRQEINIECLAETATVGAKSVHGKQQTAASHGSWRGGNGGKRGRR